MIFEIFQSIVVSIIFIFISHQIYLLLKEKFSKPIVIDVLKSSQLHYENIINQINMETNIVKTNNDDNLVQNDIENVMSENDMKSELESFLQNNI